MASQILTECFIGTAKIEITPTPKKKWSMMKMVVNQRYFERHPPTIPDPNPTPTEEPDWDLEEDRQWY